MGTGPSGSIFGVLFPTLTPKFRFELHLEVEKAGIYDNTPTADYWYCRREICSALCKTPEAASLPMKPGHGGRAAVIPMPGRPIHTVIHRREHPGP